MRMKARKILAGLLTAATVMTSMSMPAWADVGANVAGLTAYNTEYSNPTTVGDATGVTVMVTGADSNWSAAPLSEAQASSVQWSIVGSDAGNITVQSGYEDFGEDGYVAYAWVDVSQTTQPGLAVVEATKPSVGSVDFSIVINPDEGIAADVSNIKCRIYSANTTLASFSAMTVNANNYYENSKYPSAMDCTAGLLSQTGTPVNNYNIAYGMLNSLTINNVQYPEAGSSDYWFYRVYDATGNIKPMSALVGAGDFSLQNGDIVVWKCGAYGAVTFENTIQP